jgi:glycosyltransferase involved in cell wall biosynthesis
MPTSIHTVANPEAPDADRNARLFAVLGAWMEADVVSSTVRNALTQGCERVYLVDNGSPDDTVIAAIAAGATLARTFETERYDESLRLAHMNGVMESVTREEGSPIWWLFLDGDEFPHGPWGMTLREYLRTLDRRFRIVGMRCFDHYPSGPPYFERGRHPLDHQPLCEELAFPMCPARHRKHSLVRFDPDGPPLSVGNGFHLVECDVPLEEPAQPAFPASFSLPRPSGHARATRRAVVQGRGRSDTRGGVA